MTKTETVSTERLHEIKASVGTTDMDLISGREIAAMATELIASRTQSPAEWQVEKAARALSINHWGDEQRWEMHMDDARVALRAASIPAPEGETCPDCGRKKAKTAHDAANGLCPKWWAIRDADADKDCRRFAALETPPLHKEGEVEYITVDHKGCVFHSKDMDGIARIAKANLEAAVAAAAPVPVPVTIDAAAKRICLATGLDWDDLPETAANDSTEDREWFRVLARAAVSKPGEQG